MSDRIVIEMSKRDLVIFLFKWKKSLIGYFMFTVALSVILVYVIPQKYQASAKLLVESNRAPLMRADTAYGVDPMNVLNSEIAIIRSNAVFQATADRIGPKDLDGTKDKQAEENESEGLASKLFSAIGEWMLDVGLREPLTAREGFIGELEDGLKVEPSPNSGVITISYKSKEPERAAEIVNTVTDLSIQQHLKIFSSGGTSEIYKQQIERLEKDLSKQRKELTDYKSDKSVSAIKETISSLVQQQSQLTSELSATQKNLEELQTRFGKGHTKVILAEKRLHTTEDRLAELKEKLQKLEREETMIHDMEVEISSIENSIINYTKKYQDEQLESMSNPDVINVLIIEKATVPTRPDHSRLFYIVLAVLGGMLLSLAIAIIKEYFDHCVTDPEVASRLLGVPTLGSIERA